MDSPYKQLRKAVGTYSRHEFPQILRDLKKIYQVVEMLKLLSFMYRTVGRVHLCIPQYCFPRSTLQYLKYIILTPTSIGNLCIQLLNILLLTMNASQICAICQQEPEQLLILSCHHNLCLNCASQLFLLNNNNNILACQICLAETLLDPQALAHFQTLGDKQQLKKSAKSKANIVPPKTKSSHRIPQKLKSICQIHKQPVLYYCFNCNSTNICSECILTEKHSNHKVVTIKKAIETLEKRTQQEIGSYNIIRRQLEEQKSYYANQKIQAKKEFQNRKQQVKQSIDEIAQLISQKYAELSSTIQNECNKVQKLYEACLFEIAQKQRLLEESIRIQRRALEQTSKSEDMVTEFMFSSMNDNKGIFIPNLPKQMPSCAISLQNFQNLNFQICQLLSRLCLNKQQIVENSIDYSLTKQQNLIEEGKTVHKQSCKKNMNSNKSYNKMGSSRKLDLSRSLENAAYIINRLQQRSAKVN